MKTDREVMQQALEALDSDNPDIQLRAAIALREALERAKHMNIYPFAGEIKMERAIKDGKEVIEWEPVEREHGLVAAEREACAKIAQDWDSSHPDTNYGACIANSIRAR